MGGILSFLVDASPCLPLPLTKEVFFMRLSIQNLSFTYNGSPDPVFPGWSVELDTSWRLGLTGRNGRGKTTLLRLLSGKHSYQGKILMPLTPVYFPYPVADPNDMTIQVLEEASGGEPQWKLMRELKQLDVREDVLYRPFCTLSRGEMTKVLLCALFTRDDVYPLIDEPTNHLDMLGRQAVARYLRRKDGFLLVSHDRAFLNECIDHVLSINRTGFEVIQGDYDAWQEQFDRRNAYEQRRNSELKQDIAKLTDSARQAAAFAAKTETGKFHVAESEVAAVDRGYVGARSAAMMKRAKNTLRRRERALEEKKTLLHDVEMTGGLKITTLQHPKQDLVVVENAAIRYGDLLLKENIHLTVRQGQRIALTGSNGCGKSSIIKSLAGVSDALQGTVSTATGLTLSYVPQETDHLHGTLREFISQNSLNETLVKAILRNLGLSREQFDLPLEGFSDGQKKKVLLAASLATPAHLYLWDEPLNYIDVLSRRQIEELILSASPTMLLVEHDRVFLDNVVDQRVEL